MLATEQILLKERIRHLLHIKKCTISSLSENETDRVRISRQINGDANVTIDTIRLILFSFPNVSADWLILGDSKTDKSNHFSTPILSNAADSTYIPSIDDAIAQNSNFDISSRIKYVLSEKQVSVAELAGSETQRIKFSRQLNGHNGLTLPVVVKVLDRFPDVSAEWLIRGEGQMDKSNHFAPHVHVVGGGSAFINEHSVIGTQKSDPIIIQSKDELEKLMHSPEGFFSIRTIFDAKDDAIAQRDALINTLRAQIDQLTKDKELLHGLLESMTVPAKSNSKTTKNR